MAGVTEQQKSEWLPRIAAGNPDGSTAVDYMVNCATGYPFMTGQAKPDAPVNHVLPAWDIACAFQAAFSIVAAAGRRGQSVQGAELRLALSDVAFSMPSHLGLTGKAELLQQTRPANGNYIYGAFGRNFGTADGCRLIVAAITSGQWAALVIACDLPTSLADLQHRLRLDFATESGRHEGREAIATVLDDWCGSRSFEQVQQAFDAHRVCWGPYSSTLDLIQNDPCVSLANPLWERLHTAGIGSHLSASSPRFESVAKRAAWPSPHPC